MALSTPTANPSPSTSTSPPPPRLHAQLPHRLRRGRKPPAGLEVQLYRRHPPGLRLLQLHLSRPDLLTAEALNEHPTLGKGADGFYAYTWRGFLDKTDGTYLSAFLIASAFHEDTRYYPLGAGHPIIERVLYVISREAVAKTYSGNDTPSIAGLGGKVLTQYISTFYYPPSSEGFCVLAEKFGYSVMRDVAFSGVREFYPDLAAHYIRKHRENVTARDAKASGATP